MEEILRMLSEDGRLSPTQIAERTGRDEAEVKNIIADAEKQGIIIKYKGIVNWDKIGVEEVFAFIDVKVHPQRGVGFDAIAERIMKFPEVHSLYLMSGAYDLHVVVKGKNMKDIAFFVAEKLATLEGVSSTSSHFVLKRYKMDGDVLDSKAEPNERLSVTP